MSTVARNSPEEELASLRQLLGHATQSLLAETIGVAESDWRGSSLLPGWSRGHVATHIARNADGMTRLVEWARTGERIEMYPSAESRTADIEDGAGRPGVDLHVDLDSSAGRLAMGFDRLDREGGWDATVQMRGGFAVPTRLLPLARLLEVEVHHVDLDIGYTFADLDETVAQWLLEWCEFRLRVRVEFPALELVSDAGFTIKVGQSGGGVRIAGSTASLLGWLTGRLGADAVRGDPGLQLPAF